MSTDCKHPAERLETSAAATAKRLLLDWRLWAIAFGFGLLGGALSELIEFKQVGPLIGVPVGLYAALRVGRIRRCQQCGAAVELPFTSGS
jgi:hypothetical protein